MRIWDINPGYLNRNSLLGEHRELHAIVSIIENNKTGYSKHPETLRWVNYGWALKMRHDLLKCEMELRGFKDRTPVIYTNSDDKWPQVFVDTPGKQYGILKGKYEGKEHGRIPLPENVQELWNHHKYSVMARDYNLYKEIGKEISQDKGWDFNELSEFLVKLLRQTPGDKSMRNTLQHIWGYVSEYGKITGKELYNTNQLTLLKEIQKRSIDNHVGHLLNSTALSELEGWL